MKICFITKEELSYDEAPPSRILNLKRTLSNFHEVHIIGRGGTVSTDNLIGLRIGSENLIKNQLFKLLVLMNAIRLMITTGIDYFIIRDYIYLILFYPFTKLFGSKLIYDMHCFRFKELEVEDRKIKSIWVKRLETLSHRLANKISIISDGLYEDMEENIKAKTFMLENGVCLDDFKDIKINKVMYEKYDIPKHKKIVGFVGNWMEWVDVPTLLEASHSFDDTIKLVIIGRCYQEFNILSLRKRYPNVIFTGRIDHKDVLDLLAVMDVCVLPYKRAEVIKHLSIRKTLEYLAAGKAIVMSDSNIREKDFLTQDKNVILYKPGKADDLTEKINYLCSSPGLIKKMALANKKLSHKFGWDRVVKDSALLDVLDTIRPKGDIKGKVSIIIKALNEQEHIAECIQSALEAVKGLDGEVILADSMSDDNTIKIASKFPIKIVQLTDKQMRCCGIGPQLGYMHCKGDFIYILDGDMVLDKEFIKKALPYFGDKRIAGIGGNIFEKSKDNLAFQVRTKSHTVNNPRYVKQLGMGGLYRKKYIDEVGYFSNYTFYAYEEYDIADELNKKGHLLVRIPEKMVDHYGDETPSSVTILNRMKSKYLLGSGQYLRRSIQRKHFLKTVWTLKIYVGALLWCITGGISLLIIPLSTLIIKVFFSITMILLIFLFIKKRNLNRLFFSILSWNSQALGMLIGFFLKIRDPVHPMFKTKVLQWNTKKH